MNGLLILALTAVIGATMTINWTPGTDARQYGHKIYYSNYSGNPPFPYSVQVNDNTSSHVFSNISVSKKYCYAVSFMFYTSAHQTGSAESALSNKQCGKITVHSNFANTPNYRISGADNPAPSNYEYNPIPDCGQCHH